MNQLRIPFLSIIVASVAIAFISILLAPEGTKEKEEENRPEALIYPFQKAT